MDMQKMEIQRLNWQYYSEFVCRFCVGYFVLCRIYNSGFFCPPGNKLRTVAGIFIVYFVFAFLINLMREVIKDIEDIEGDKMQNIKTLPLIVGVKMLYFCNDNTKYFTPFDCHLDLEIRRYTII